MSDRELPPRTHTQMVLEKVSWASTQHPRLPPRAPQGGAVLDNKCIFANEEDNVIIFE